MWVLVVCLLLTFVGLLAVVRWGGLTVQPPPLATPPAGGPTEPPPVGLVVRRYLWYLTVAVTSGLGAGILAAGAGGRLVMRLLAVTAGPDAQGRITEAEQVVGRITVDGTLGFVVFTGLFFGLASGFAYLLLHRLLPAGWGAGLAYGALLLVVAGTRLEPLRRSNPDFDLVGPGWVSVTAFALLVVFHGVLVAALAGRFSRAVPLLAAEPRALAAHAPLLLLLLLPPVVGVLAVVGVVIVLVSRVGPIAVTTNAHRLVAIGRVALILVGLAALPGFTAAVVDILGRS